MMRLLKWTNWELLSYVPGTKQHRQYNATIEYVSEVEAWVDTLGMTGRPRFPQPIPRHPYCCQIAVTAMLALVHAGKAFMGGSSNVAAVFEEHMPQIDRKFLPEAQE